MLKIVPFVIVYIVVFCKVQIVLKRGKVVWYDVLMFFFEYVDCFQGLFLIIIDKNAF